MDITPLQDEMSRLKNLKATWIYDCRTERVLIVDIAGISFEPGMKKVLESMKNE
jgi:hypothetical protein